MRWPWTHDSRYQQSQFSAGAGQDSLARFIIALTTVLVLLSSVAVAASLYYFRGETLRAGERLTQSIVHVVEEQTTRTFQTIDQRLLLAANLIQKRQADRNFEEGAAQELLRDQLKALPFVRAIWVLDSQGRIIFDSDAGNVGVARGEHEYFQVYQQKPATEFHISAPVRSGSTKRWQISASRPLRSPGGKLTGVIVAAVDPSYFEALWRGIDLGEGGTVTLLRRDTVLMMRSPTDDASMGKTFANLPLFTHQLQKNQQGIFLFTSLIDGRERLNGYRVLTAYPDLIVVVGSLYSDILAPWRRFATLAGLIWLAAAATIMLLTAQLLMYSRQRQRNEIRFQRLAQAMPQIVFVANPAGQVTFISEQWHEVTGQPVEMALRDGWAKFIHPDDRQQTLESMQQMRLAEIEVQHEHRLLCRDGTYRWRLVRAVPNRNNHGTVTSWYGTSTDVDELKTAEARLKEQADLLTLAGRLSHVCGWQVDLASQRIVWSEEAAAMLDLPAEESPALSSIIEQCTPGSRELTETTINACLNHGTPFDIEVEMHTRSGRRIWVRSIGQPVRDADGKITGMQGAQQDITSRVLTEQKLQTYLHTLQRAAEAALAITQHQRLDALTREVAEQARVISGARRAVLEIHDSRDHAASMQTVAGSEEPVRPSDEGDALSVPLTGRSGAAIGLLRLSGKVEGHFSHQDEYVVTELAQLASIAIDNVRLLAQIRELNTGLEEKVAQRTSELSRQEALFRTLAERAPQPIWTVDPRGSATFFSKAWYDLAGGAPPDWHGLGWIEVMHPDDMLEMSQNWVRCSKSLSLFTGIRRLRSRTGEWHTMSYQAAPVLDENGRVTFWVGLDVDVTETKAIENALRLSNAELEAFSYSVSHDLRSPLTTVDGFSRLLLKELQAHDSKKVQHYLDRIQQGVARMGHLIEGLLSLAQVARVELRMAPVDMSPLAHDILERLQGNDRSRDVTCQVEPGLMVQGDSRLITSVMENLLGNAWKFTARQAEAVITVGRVAPRGAFFVRDNGTGFDMAYADKLFGTFQRLHDASEYAGTGIGLATVSRIIARHGGTIWAESEPGRGATFYFKLPTPAT